MKLVKRYLPLLLVCLFCLGCGAKHCLKVDADLSEGRKGGFEYCLDLTGTEKEGRLVLNGEGGKTWGLKEEEIKKLLDQIGVNSLAAPGKDVEIAKEISLVLRLREALK